MTFTHWFEYFQRSSIHDGTYSIGEEAWNAAKADDTPPNPQHGRDVKPLAQCLAEHIKYQHSTNIIFWEIGDLMKDIEQALDAYQSTENVTIKIEGV